MKYELFYARGGHGGPYQGKDAAMKAARRLVGGANGSYIDVVPYSQPWEATPVRDLHLLRGVHRVYDPDHPFSGFGTLRGTPGDWYEDETLADKKFAERNPGGKKDTYPHDYYVVADGMLVHGGDDVVDSMNEARRLGNEIYSPSGKRASGESWMMGHPKQEERAEAAASTGEGVEVVSRVQAMKWSLPWATKGLRDWAQSCEKCGSGGAGGWAAYYWADERHPDYRPNTGEKMIIVDVEEGGLGVTLRPRNKRVRRQMERHTKEFTGHSDDSVFLQEWRGDEFIDEHLTPSQAAEVRNGWTVGIKMDPWNFGHMVGYDFHEVINP